MGKQYLAVNEIRHGKDDGTLQVFAPGSAVTGLPKETMVALWEAGVLTEFDPQAAPKDHRDDEIAALKAQLAAMEAEKAAAAETVQAAAEQEPPTDAETVPDPDATA